MTDDEGRHPGPRRRGRRRRRPRAGPTTRRTRTIPAPPTSSPAVAGDERAPPLRFGPDDTGPLPHWTEPPTGEVPRIFAEDVATDDVDAWSSSRPAAPGLARRPGRVRRPTTTIDFASARRAATTASAPSTSRPRPVDPFFDDERRTDRPEPRAVPGDADPHPAAGAGRHRAPARAATSARSAPAAQPGRDLPMAVGVGVASPPSPGSLLAAGARYAMVLVVAVARRGRRRVLRQAAGEGLPAGHAGRPRGRRGHAAGRLLEGRGRAAARVLPRRRGHPACGSSWRRGIESGPLPNTAVTLLGVALHRAARLATRR